MKKNIFTIAIILLVASQLFGQGYKKGVNNLNIGAGMGLNGITGESSLPPISIGYQLGIADKYSIGAIVGYSSSTSSVLSYEWTYTYIVVGGRGEYHFMKSTDKLDAYAGATLGYTIVSASEPDNLPAYVTSAAATGYLIYGAHAGVRYAFSKSFGAFAEVGYGISLVTVGINFKL